MSRRSTRTSRNVAALLCVKKKLMKLNLAEQIKPMKINPETSEKNSHQNRVDLVKLG